MTEDDLDRRMEMCNWFLQNIEHNTQFLSTVLFSDEANFYKLTDKIYVSGQTVMFIGLLAWKNKELSG